MIKAGTSDYVHILYTRNYAWPGTLSRTTFELVTSFKYLGHANG